MDIKKRSLASDPGRRQSVFQGLFGRRDVELDVSGKSSNIVAMLRTAFGEGRQGRPVDTKAAASGLGVSQRTVQRWIAGEGKQRIKAPRTEHLAALRKASRQAATTRKGRKRMIDDARRSRRFAQGQAKGIRLTVRGMSGFADGGQHYLRYRSVPLKLTPDQVDAMWSAYEQGGDKGFSQWLTSRSQDYLTGWEYESIDSLQFDSLKPGE